MKRSNLIDGARYWGFAAGPLDPLVRGVIQQTVHLLRWRFDGYFPSHTILYAI